MNKKFKVSIVVPVYNAELYLEECLQSIVEQTIGFKDNIELILINDGSTDDSESICINYRNKYPDNIKYQFQENAGVSAARNSGHALATGEFIEFVDSDDKLESNALEKGVEFLEKNQCIEFVAYRLKFFDASDDYHMLDYKFTEDTIINIIEQPENLILHGSTILIRKSAIENLFFDERVNVSEDTKFIFELLIKNCMYGVLRSARYFYRKSPNETSLIQNARYKEYWYTSTIEYVHKYLCSLSEELYGDVIDSIQFFIMYELQWRLKYGIPDFLTYEQQIKYKDDIIFLLKKISDSCIVEQKNIGTTEKILALMLKHDGNVGSLIDVKNRHIEINSAANKRLRVINHINEFEIIDNRLHIIGDVDFINPIKLYYKTNKQLVQIKTYERKDNNRSWGMYVPRNGYSIFIDLDNVNAIEFYMEYLGAVYLLKNSTIHYSRLNNQKTNYYYEEKVLIRHANKRRRFSIVHKPSVIKIAGHEIRYLWNLWKNGRRNIVGLRLLYHATKPFKRKPIWLFCDREFMAGDSAEVLFKHVLKKEGNNKHNKYFVISKRYSDYERMKQYGKVCSYHTLKYKILFLHSDLLISSHADGYVNNALGKDRKYLINFFRFEYVYLTHGILLHDSSNWLNRVNKNFALNVVTSPMEYKSIVEGNYYFEPEQLIKTGIPRYDNYFNMNVEEVNQILFMPSWRSTLAGKIIPGTQRRMYNSDFTSSEYYLFYKGLFSNDKLLEKLRKENVKILFCIHPSFRTQKEDFEKLANDVVRFETDMNSQEATLSSKCLVTDYSSAACDFAYIGKPVIYANFDYDHIHDIHYYNEGYFDYDRDGFGPNCKTEDEVVGAITRYIDNRFNVEDCYVERMNKFFYYRDANNSERVYKEIIKL